MEDLLKDVRYGARLLLRNPGFSAIAILSLALGIGANTAIFSVVQQLLASPFPVEQPQQLVSVFTTDRRNPGNLPMSHLNFKDLRAQNTAFSDMAAVAFTQVNYLGEGGAAEQLAVQVVSASYFDVLGAKPALGRSFRADEDAAPGSGPVAVISYGLWDRRFGKDASIVGKTLSLNRQPFTVVGVAGEGFNGTVIFGAPDLWVPMSMHDVVQPGFDWYEQRRGLFLLPFGRLKPGVTLGQAQANLRTLGTRLERDYPNDNQGRNVAALPLLEARLNPQGGRGGPIVQGSLLLMVIVGVVLLIACANIANLLLARATSRSKEIAVRLAIGARRARLVRQLLTESVLLALIGGAIGLVVGYWTLDLIRSAPIELPPNFLRQIAIDPRVMAFTAALSLVTGILFGLVPALRASKPDLVPVLKNETVPVVGGSRGFFRWVTLRQALVVGQVALSLVALVAAGLFLRSLQQIQDISPGFDTTHVLAAALNLGREGYTREQGLQFHDRLVERAASLPGVTSVALAQNLPFGGGIARSVLLEGSETSEQNRTLVQVNVISPGYLQTVGIPVLSGRDFNPQDTTNTPLAVIINETMAEKFFPKGDAVGRRFRFFGDTADSTIIGIARNAKYNGLVEQPQPFIYQPLRQAYTPAVNLLVRTRGDASLLASATRALIHQLDPRLSILRVRTLGEQVDLVLAPNRVVVVLLSVFGVLALLLAAIGLYGVASYSVTQRTREIGIRMALGATRSAVMRLVLVQGLALVAAGVVAGMAIASLLAQSVRGLLVGVQPTDPITFVLTAVVLLCIAVLASYFPARRAMRIDPLVALRYQ
jgi:putative ABC transport system permease protein